MLRFALVAVGLLCATGSATAQVDTVKPAPVVPTTAAPATTPTPQEVAIKEKGLSGSSCRSQNGKTVCAKPHHLPCNSPAGCSEDR